MLCFGPVDSDPAAWAAAGNPPTHVYHEDQTMKGIEAYRQTAIGTQSKGRLIVMLYDGAIKFMKLAIRELEAENYAAKGQYINRAQDIINELNAVLDADSGGEIAHNLRRLYLFMGRRLSEANTKRDPQMIREVIGLMEELNQSWRAITG
jgi:flagellar protein FliS